MTCSDSVPCFWSCQVCSGLVLSSVTALSRRTGWLQGGMGTARKCLHRHPTGPPFLHWRSRAAARQPLLWPQRCVLVTRMFHANPHCAWPSVKPVLSPEMETGCLAQSRCRPVSQSACYQGWCRVRACTRRIKIFFMG